MVTIHSRAMNQKYNDHYKNRASERCSFDTTNPAVMKRKLAELKCIMQNPDNFIQSHKHEDRFIVTCLDGYDWILGKQH